MATENPNVQVGGSNGHAVYVDPNQDSNPKEPVVGAEGVSASDALEFAVVNAEARAKVQEDERKAFAKSQQFDGPVLSEEETKEANKKATADAKAAEAKKTADKK